MTTHGIHTLSSTVPTKVTPEGVHSGIDVSIQNINTSGYIYVGGSANISSSTYGYRISPNNGISFELDGLDGLYLIASADNLQAAVITCALADK